MVSGLTIFPTALEYPLLKICISGCRISTITLSPSKKTSPCKRLYHSSCSVNINPIFLISSVYSLNISSFSGAIFCPDPN